MQLFGVQGPVPEAGTVAVEDPKNGERRIRRRQQTIIKIFSFLETTNAASICSSRPVTLHGRAPPDALAMSCRSLWLVQLVLMEIFIERHGAWRVVAGPMGRQ